MPEFTFMREIQIPQDIFPLLIQGEQPVCAFATFRDGSVFTNKRLILRDVQGMTGNKVQVMSLPYSQIVSWASENAGHTVPSLIDSGSLFQEIGNDPFGGIRWR